MGYIFFFSHTVSAIQRFLHLASLILDLSIRRARSCLVTSKGSSSLEESNCCMHFVCFFVCILYAFWKNLKKNLKTSWIRVELKRQLPRAHQVEAFHRSPHAHPSKNVTMIPCDEITDCFDGLSFFEDFAMYSRSGDKNNSPLWWCDRFWDPQASKAESRHISYSRRFIINHGIMECMEYYKHHMQQTKSSCKIHWVGR